MDSERMRPHIEIDLNNSLHDSFSEEEEKFSFEENNPETMENLIDVRKYF